MANHEKHVERVRTLSENDETEIRRNIVRGEAFLLGGETKKATSCFQNIVNILDEIEPQIKYI